VRGGVWVLGEREWKVRRDEIRLDEIRECRDGLTRTSIAGVERRERQGGRKGRGDGGQAVESPNSVSASFLLLTPSTFLGRISLPLPSYPKILEALQRGKLHLSDLSKSKEAFSGRETRRAHVSLRLLSSSSNRPSRLLSLISTWPRYVSVSFQAFTKPSLTFPPFFVPQIVPFRARFPWEILLSIFDQADPSTLAALGGVSMDVMETTSPSLYRIVTITSVKQLKGLFCRREEETTKVSSSRQCDLQSLPLLLSLLRLSGPLNPSSLLALLLRLSIPLHFESSPSSTLPRSTTSSSTSPPSPPSRPSPCPSPEGRPLNRSLSNHFKSPSDMNTSISSTSFTPNSSLTSTQSIWSTASENVPPTNASCSSSKTQRLSSSDSRESSLWCSEELFP